MPLKHKLPTEKTLIDCLLITLAIFIPYHQVAQHTFVDYDDDAYIFLNNHINHGMTWDNVIWAFTNVDLANWHPLTWISHLIDRELFGTHPGGYLLMNVAWHTLAACLCYFVFLKCTKSRVFAITVALIFALHPVNVENVAWASERKSLLNAVFWFAALLSYLDFIETRSFKGYGWTVIFFILSLFCKAMSVTLPCSLVLIHYLYLVYHPCKAGASEPNRATWRQVILPPMPLLLLSFYFSVITSSAQSVAMVVDTPLASRVVNSVLSYERYLVMFFHPTDLAFFYPLNFDLNPDFRSAVPALLVLVTLSVSALLLMRRKPQLLIGWCWFLGTLVPVIGLVQAGGQSHADRYLYIPMLGLAIILPTLFEILNTLGARCRSLFSGLFLAGYSAAMLVATQIQVTYWQDGITLCRHSLAITGYAFNPMLSLSLTFLRTERIDEFFAYIDSCMAIEKNIFNLGIMAMLKAHIQFNQHRYADTIKTTLLAIDLGLANKESYALIALSCYRLGQLDDAAKYLAMSKNAIEPNQQNILFTFSLEKDLFLLEKALDERSSQASVRSR